MRSFYVNSNEKFEMCMTMCELASHYSMTVVLIGQVNVYEQYFLPIRLTIKRVVSTGNTTQVDMSANQACCFNSQQ